MTCRSCCSSKERDAETGLDYFGARYVSSAQGRFTSQDEFAWIGTVDAFTGEPVQQLNPLPYADINNPQSLNKYANVLNNPLRYTDPDGHCTNGVDTMLCVAAGAAVAKIITDFIDYKNRIEEGKVFADYYSMLLERAIQVCTNGSNGCGQALEAAERARLASVKRLPKTAQAASQIVGTSVSGPIPASRDDLVSGVVVDLAISAVEAVGQAQQRRAEQQKNKRDKEQAEQPRKRDRENPRKNCLIDRDGNCVQ